jgi:predicted DNA-binding transcriptional regulator AlpA
LSSPEIAMTVSTERPTRDTGPDPPGQSLLLSVRDLARLLGRSVPSLDRDDAAGRLPAPVRIGGSKKWRRAEIVAWVAAGCPDRASWTFHPQPDRS